MQHDGGGNAAMRTLLTASSLPQANGMFPNPNANYGQRQVAPPVEPVPRAWPLAVHNDSDIEQLDADGMYIVCRICSELDKARNGSRIVRMNAPFRVAAWERHKARNSAHKQSESATEPTPYADLMASYPDIVPQGVAPKPRNIAPNAAPRPQSQAQHSAYSNNGHHQAQLQPQPVLNMQAANYMPQGYAPQLPQQMHQLQPHQAMPPPPHVQQPSADATTRMHPIVPIKRPLPPPSEPSSRKKKKEKPIAGCMGREMVGSCPGAIPFEKCQTVQAHLKAFQRFIIPAPTFGIYYNEETQWYQVYSRACAREPMLNRRPSRGQACEACYQLYSDRQRLMWKRITNMEGLLGAIETIKATSHAEMDTSVLVRFLQGKACLYTAEGLQVRQTSKKALEYLTERRRLLEDLEFRTSGTQLI